MTAIALLSDGAVLAASLAVFFALIILGLMILIKPRRRPERLDERVAPPDGEGLGGEVVFAGLSSPVPTAELVPVPVLRESSGVVERILDGRRRKREERSRPMSFLLQYRREDGDVQDRVVDIWKISRSYTGEVYFDAFCHLRGDRRRFRPDRVISMASPATGEIVDDPVGFFRKNVGWRYRE
ncbi:WYL domain-containing protein [uncultured Cohaesibacter sp.]|uniref:WYL domain-containing protein n=1 Tax=uncultured Cohaesibacter sp. TaxID=1002546 RepID=UPI0029C927F0|nr:WYL domain-containing protein [uncultured Cohaesibacter sp.]